MQRKHCLINNIIYLIMSVMIKYIIQVSYYKYTYRGMHADKLVKADSKGQGSAPFFFNLAWSEWILKPY